jgi:hypothetical protein
MRSVTLRAAKRLEKRDRAVNLAIFAQALIQRND